MPRRVSTAIWLPLIGRLRRQLPSRESQAENRCVPFLWLVYQVLSKAGPRTAICIACLSTLHGTDRSVVLRPNPEGTLLYRCVYRLVTKPSPGSAKNLVHRSTTLTTTRFSTYFLFVDQFSSAIMNMAISSGIGAANTGGTSSFKFAEGGDISSFLRPFTCASTSFVRMARP